jgi:glycosyltransferase involved in cell wall biosynthesis
MVSIIIPYKNPNPFFKECLNSIINQTYKNIQIILVNDHSSDNSEKNSN